MSRERLGFLKSLQKGQPRIPEGKAEAAPVKTTKLIGNERIAYLSRVGEPCQTIVPKQVLEDGAGSLVPEVCLDLASLQGFTTRSAVAGGAASSSTGRGTGKRPHYDNRLRKLNAKFANRMAFLDLVAQSNFYFNEKVCLDRFEVWSQEKLGNIVSTQHVRHKMNGKSRRRIDSLWESSCRCSKACFRKLPFCYCGAHNLSRSVLGADQTATRCLCGLDAGTQQGSHEYGLSISRRRFGTCR